MNHDIQDIHEDKHLRHKILDFADDWKNALYDFALRKKEPALSNSFKQHMWDAESINMFSMILATAYKFQQDNGGEYLYAKISLEELRRKRRNTLAINTIKERLEYFARAWLLTVDSSNWKSKTRRDTQSIYLNNAFAVIFKPRQQKLKSNFLKSSVAIFLERELGFQGLWFECAYGENELDPKNQIKRVVLGEYTLDRTKKTEDKLKEKASDLKAWQKHRDDFLHMAGRLWTGVRVSLGYGVEDPDWSATRGQISSAQRKQRSNMSDTFARHGGRSTALAWYLYCTGEKKYDSKGKLVFDPTISHRQYKNPDMSPEKFAAQFFNITSEPAYLEYMGERYEEGEKILLEWFTKEILEVGPKDGTSEHVRRGYCAGEKPLPELPKNV